MALLRGRRAGLFHTRETKHGLPTTPPRSAPGSTSAAVPAWQFTVVILAGATISPLLLAAAPITLVIIVWQLRGRGRA